MPVLLMAGTGEGHQASWGRVGATAKGRKSPQSLGTRGKAWVWGSCTYHSPHYSISADKNNPKQSPGGVLFLQLTEQR